MRGACRARSWLPASSRTGPIRRIRISRYEHLIKTALGQLVGMVHHEMEGAGRPPSCGRPRHRRRAASTPPAGPRTTSSRSANGHGHARSVKRSDRDSDSAWNLRQIIDWRWVRLPCQTISGRGDHGVQTRARTVMRDARDRLGRIPRTSHTGPIERRP